MFFVMPAAEIAEKAVRKKFLRWPSLDWRVRRAEGREAGAKAAVLEMNSEEGWSTVVVKAVFRILK